MTVAAPVLALLLAIQAQTQTPTRPVRASAPQAGEKLLKQDEIIDKILAAAGVGDSTKQPTAKQISAPASSGAAATTVDRASFPELFAFAADSVNFSGSAATITVNPFGFVAARNHLAVDSQSEYQKYSGLRRIAGTVTLGGKGDKFDRDGDGKDDDPLTAQNLGDIATFEVMARIWGTRDRRDPQNYRRYLNHTKSEVPLTDQPMQDLVALIMAEGAPTPDGVPETNVNKVLASPTAKAALERLRKGREGLDKAIQAANEATDKRLIWTLVVGGTQRKPQFGSDKWNAGLRGEGATGRLDHTINVDWSQVKVTAGDDPTVLKIGYQAAVKVLTGTALTKEGATLSADGAFEHYEHVADAKYPTIAKFGLKLEVPITKSASLPLSATYANHKDLLTGQQGWIGHVGIAWDLSPLKALTDKSKE
jgi:hypothetical protein